MKYIFTNDGKTNSCCALIVSFLCFVFRVSISLALVFSCAAFSFSMNSAILNKVYLVCVAHVFHTSSHPSHRIDSEDDDDDDDGWSNEWMNEKKKIIHTMMHAICIIYCFVPIFPPYLLTSSGMHVPLTFDGIGRVRVSTHFFIGGKKISCSQSIKFQWCVKAFHLDSPSMENNTI